MKTTWKDLFLAIPEILNPKVILYTFLVAFLVIFEGIIPTLWEKITGVFGSRS